jgi:hypothetical protein
MAARESSGQSTRAKPPGYRHPAVTSIQTHSTEPIPPHANTNQEMAFFVPVCMVPF